MTHAQTAQLSNAYDRAPPDAISVSPASFAIERERFERSLTPDELFQELAQAEDEVFSAFRTGDHALIGRLVLSVMDARLDRLTARDLGIGMKTYEADEAARIVLLSRNLEALTNRRSV